MCDSSSEQVSHLTVTHSWLHLQNKSFSFICFVLFLPSSAQSHIKTCFPWGSWTCRALHQHKAVILQRGAEMLLQYVYTFECCQGQKKSTKKSTMKDKNQFTLDSWIIRGIHALISEAYRMPEGSFISGLFKWPWMERCLCSTFTSLDFLSFSSNKSNKITGEQKRGHKIQNKTKIMCTHLSESSELM